MLGVKHLEHTQCHDCDLCFEDLATGSDSWGRGQGVTAMDRSVLLDNIETEENADGLRDRKWSSSFFFFFFSFFLFFFFFFFFFCPTSTL